MIEVEGEVPTSGTITILNGNITGLNVVLTEKEITRNSKAELVYVKSLKDVCEFKVGTPKAVGAKYECKVDPNEDAYIFYVLNTRNKAGEIITESSTDKEAVSINLIMAQNINSDGTPTTRAILETDKDKNDNSGKYNLVSWINQDAYESAGGQNWDEWTDNNTFGPLTAMNFLSEATKNWTNTNEMLINLFDSNDNSAPLKDMKVYNTYARMPYYSEVSDVSRNKMWLIGYLDGEYDEFDGIVGRENPLNDINGYWTLSAHSARPSCAWFVDCSGNVSCGSILSDDILGVRPVINLKI